MTIERHLTSGRPIEAPARLPSADVRFAHLCDLVNLLVAHHGGDRLAVAKDLASMAAALVSGDGYEAHRAALARAMAEAARRLDPDAARAPGGLQ